MNKQKGFATFSSHERGFAPILILVGILVLAAVTGGGIYWTQKINKEPSTDRAVLHLKQLSDTDKIIDPKSSANPNQDETVNPDQIGANWKTYTDDKLKISFKYPSIYTVVKLAENGIFLVRTEAEKKSLEDCFARKQPECNSYSLSLYFENPERNQNLSLKEFVAIYTHTPASDYTSIIVAGLPALQKQFEGIGTVNDVFIDKGKSVFYLRANSIIDPQENMVSFNKILSTFRFD